MTLSLDPDQRQRLVSAIADAERGSRGELKLHIESECPGDPLERARHFFHAMGMAKTQDDTGVLLYVAPTSKDVSIYAGGGIHKAAGEALWTEAVRLVADGFRRDDGLSGIEAAVSVVGEALRRCAPGEDTAGDELSNEVGTS